MHLAKKTLSEETIRYFLSQIGTVNVFIDVLCDAVCVDYYSCCCWYNTCSQCDSPRLEATKYSPSPQSSLIGVYQSSGHRVKNRLGIFNILCLNIGWASDLFDLFLILLQNFCCFQVIFMSKQACSQIMLLFRHHVLTGFCLLLHMIIQCLWFIAVREWFNCYLVIQWCILLGCLMWLEVYATCMLCVGFSKLCNIRSCNSKFARSLFPIFTLEMKWSSPEAILEFWSDSLLV